MKDKMFWANTPVGHAKMITDIKNYGVWFQSGMKHAVGEKEWYWPWGGIVYCYCSIPSTHDWIPTCSTFV